MRRRLEGRDIRKGLDAAVLVGERASDTAARVDDGVALGQEPVRTVPLQQTAPHPLNGIGSGLEAGSRTRATLSGRLIKCRQQNHL
jgi:hypothetical protein